MPVSPEEAVGQILARSVRFIDCLIFTGTPSSKYPRVKADGVERSASRVVYEVLVGPIPDGYEVDHGCFTPRCVNVEHLEAVTPQVNKERRRYIAFPKEPRPVCNLGHERTQRSNGSWTCRICNRRYAAKSRSK